MENQENTNQIPEELDNKIQEENSSTVAETENPVINDLPTESNQIEEIAPVTDVAGEIQEDTVVEEIPVAEEIPVKEDIPVAEADTPGKTEQLAESQPVEEIIHVEDLTDEIHSEKDDHLAEELAEEIAEQEVHESEEDLDKHTREELIDLLEKAVNDPDVNSVKTRISLIKVIYIRKKKEENLQQYEQFMAEGGTKEDFAYGEDPTDIRFNEIFNIYKANKARYTEQQEKVKLVNLTKKQAILDELRSLVNSEETLKKTYDEFKNLQERWKEIGMVPRTEINNLWQNYHFLVEKFFDKVKLNKELKDLDLRKNLESKMALCEKTEELLLETSVLKSFKKLQKYHEEWKELGPVPPDKKDEIWERFKNATDKINERRRDHYKVIEEDQQKNLETKMALCEQAEEVASSKNTSIRDWQDNTNKVNELLKIWKSIGPVSQKQNNEIWTRFKTQLDNFFSVKKEFFDVLKDQQVHNYNLKVELCMQAESLKTSTDWKKTSVELIRLQNEWKGIGPVPKKNSDKIWKRFRAACDEFFNAKSGYFSNLQQHEEENLAKKNDLINRLKEHQFGEDKNENLDVLKNFQREWTEIGHIPIKEKDRLQNEFRALINEHLDRLKISEIEISTMNYQTRIETLKHDPSNKRFLLKEKDLLAGKITKMKEDINLWENNIGFLANSKNAILLKEEFEKKISKAKGEVKIMEAKLKLLKAQ
jgi:hypothetical protein